MIRPLLALLSLIFLTQPARAGTEPTVAPPGAWVEAVAPATPDRTGSNRHVQLLLMNRQAYYSADADEHFLEVVQHIESAEGLQNASNIALEWQPDHSDLIVHKVQILRGGTVIDLLATGHRFTVLRRENNLESATLDGVLTAVMQPEGLTIGDTLIFSYTVRKRAGALPLRGENLLMIPPGFETRRMFVREVWNDSRRIQWRASPAFGEPQRRRGRFGTEIFLSRENVKGPPIIEGAPLRYAMTTFFQATEFQRWEEISSLMAPHYDRAAAVSPGSALQREIDRIAALSPDPSVRTMAALRSVQDQVRYFALVMGDGNYLPATAEQTWTRRYGDCKAKTVLLIAMLRGLGVEAEPVLVSTLPGDPIDQRLPQLRQFNHVLVRARIGGRSYWLDGTRLGDRNLQELASTTLGFGLPLRSAGAPLETIAYVPPTVPLNEGTVTYDASGGIDGPVPIRLDMIMRGDDAAAFRAALAQVGMERMREQLLANMRDRRFTEATIRDDNERGEIVFAFSGRGEMEWERVPGASGRRFRFDNDTISWTPDFERPADQDGTVPFALSHPFFLVGTEVVILPNGGRGFSIEGTNLNRTVAGTEIKRELSLENGRAIARSSFRRVDRELGAQAARESLAALREINADRAFVRASLTAEMSARSPISSPSARAAPAPSQSAAAEPDAQALVASGYAKLQERRPGRALQDFERAAELAPQWSLPHANRAVALVHMNRLDEAQTAIDQALRLKADDEIAFQASAMLMLKRGRYQEALEAANRSLALDPENHFTLGMRSEIHQEMERFDEAVTDLRAMIAAEPSHAAGRARLGALLAHIGRTDEAVAAMRAAMQADPQNYTIPENLGALLARAGRADEAKAAFDEALARHDAVSQAMGRAGTGPHFSGERATLLARIGRFAEALAIADEALRFQSDSVRMLATRCLIRVYEGRDLDRALRDCDKALSYEAGNDIATAARAMGRLRARQWAGAIQDFTDMLGWDSDDATALYGRGLAKIGSGDREGGERDVAAARRQDFFIYLPFERLGFPREAGARTSPAAPVSTASQTRTGN